MFYQQGTSACLEINLDLQLLPSEIIRQKIERLIKWELLWLARTVDGRRRDIMWHFTEQAAPELSWKLEQWIFSPQIVKARWKNGGYFSYPRKYEYPNPKPSKYEYRTKCFNFSHFLILEKVMQSIVYNWVQVHYSNFVCMRFTR